MRHARVLAVTLGVLAAVLGFGRQAAQAQGNPADDDICAFLNAQGETILQNGLILQMVTDSSAFGAGAGPDGLIEGANDLGLPSSGGAVNAANDDTLAPKNDMDSFMPGGTGCADGFCDLLGYDETGPDATDTIADSVTGNPLIRNPDGTLNVTVVRACDSGLPGACTGPHGSFSHAELYIRVCEDFTTECTSSGPLGACAGIGGETCNKAVLTRGYLNGTLSAVNRAFVGNELVGEGLDTTVAMTGGTLSTTSDEPHRIDLWVTDAGPDARVVTDRDNRSECVTPGFPFPSSNGMAPGEDGMAAWASTISTDLPLVSDSNIVFWKLGEVRPRTPNQRIIRNHSDLILKTSASGGPGGTGSFVGTDVWLYGWNMPFTEAVALTAPNRFPNGNLPDLVLDQIGPDGITMGLPGDTGDAVILPGTGLAQYLSEFARQGIGGIDKSTDLLIAYITVYSEVSPDTMAALGVGPVTGYFQQFLVMTGGLVNPDICAWKVNDTSLCPAGTPRMVGGRCAVGGQFCFSDGFCESQGNPPGTRCMPNPNVSGSPSSGLVIPGSDGN